nr:MAG: hypothetical protein CM15mP61_12360 [Gammaproteobacteria bacterium]
MNWEFEQELDIYKSYKEMMEKFPEEKFKFNKFWVFRRLMKAHMILINYKAVSPKLVGKLGSLWIRLFKFKYSKSKDLSKHTKTPKGENGIHHVSSNGYRAYVEELSFAENHFFEN